jgi:hypothetical protein
MTAYDMAELQNRTFEAALTWHEGLGLEVCGVDLGPCLIYSVLQSLNDAVLYSINSTARQEAGDETGL